MKTGIAFMPGTFPTYEVRNAIIDALPTRELDWPRTKVNDLYYLYKDGIEAGYPVPKQGDLSVSKYIKENSNYTESDIRVFLYVLYNLAQAGDISQKWLNIELQDKQSLIPSIPGTKNITQTVEKTVSAVKWGSIALIIAAGIYFGWPLIRKIRR